MKTLNKHNDNLTNNYVYIGRGSPYGNPFIIGKDGNREEVIKKFESYILNNTALCDQVKRELTGKDLLCFCSPKPCHGDILIKICEGYYDKAKVIADLMEF